DLKSNLSGNISNEVNLLMNTETVSEKSLNGANIVDITKKLGTDEVVVDQILFNPTTAFIETKIRPLGSQFEIKETETEVSLKFSTVNDLFMNLANSGKTILADELDGQASPQIIQVTPDLGFLTELADVSPINLELKETGISSLVFDTRDLKKSLTEALISSDGDSKTEFELIIPQTVPLKAEVSKLETGDYDPFIAFKVNLLDTESELGKAGLLNLPYDNGLETALNLVGVTRALEIDPDVDLRSKLLIGFSVPEDTDPNSLPDFVKLDVSLESRNLESVDTEGYLPNSVQKADHFGTAFDSSEVSFDNKTNMRSLILALEEISNKSQNNTQIVTKINSNEPLLPISPELAVGLSEANASNLFASKQPLPTNHFELPKEHTGDGNDLGQKLFSLDLLPKNIVVENNATLLSTTKINAQSELISSSHAHAFFNKLFYKEKDEKTLALVDKIGVKSTDQKMETTVFNPKSFLEAAEALKMKQISFPSSPYQGDLMQGRQPDITSFGINRIDNSISPGASLSNNSAGPSASINLGELAANSTTKLSLYSAQYASRLGMLVVEKVLKGQENFEINLEPESFGKIKVNVSLDKQAMDIRMVTETQAAASLLRANEDALLQITAQNGMKLANFTVGMQTSSDQQRQNPNQNRNRVTDKANSVLEHATTKNSQTQISYRNSTGLNLIA
ncbi:MAG: flagellar hook-length control protein FliK, partial [Planktomarina sp.]|nr:flagellar hook-length control protein FliK [Planktomarina sp.]